MASLELAEPLAGSASVVGAYLLVEHGGPWGRKALQDSPFPEVDDAPMGLGPALAQACAAAGVTPLLVRRHRSRPGMPSRPQVMLVELAAAGGGGAVTSVGSPADLLALDLPGLRQTLATGGTPTGWQPLGTQFLACTNGRRDACCAELGRPLATVLSALTPEKAWEVTHLGGHRFAGNLLVLPDGIVYGRVTPDDALDLVSAHAEQRLVLPLLRGRCCLPHAVQVAEIALRQHLQADGADAVRLLDRACEAGRTTSRWQVDARVFRVVVDTIEGVGAPRRASCAAEPTAAPAQHTVVELTDVEEAGRGAAGWDEMHRQARTPNPPNDIVVEAVGPLAPGSAIDLATGTGRHALWLAERGWHVTAVDFSRAGLDEGRRQAVLRGLDVDWQLGDARQWSPSAAVDLVLMSFVHLTDAVSRAAPWVAPGGHLVVVGHALRNHTEGVGGPSDPRLLHDPKALRHDAELAGLTVLRCGEVERATADGTAIDAVLVARR